MENASKALLMVASVLVGLILLSLGVYLVNNIQSFSKSYSESIETYKNEQFNSHFTAFSTRKNVSIHEIISLVNYANEFNFSNDIEKTNDQYIDVIIIFKDKNKKINLTDVNTYPTEYKNDPDKFITDLLDGSYIYNLYKNDREPAEKEGQYQYDYDKVTKNKTYYNCFECKENDYVINSYTGRVESIKFYFSKGYTEVKN